ncbi:DNA-deoxyinosine glycosylase [Lentibacillus sediminis]|uniref:DNA-deoxyinosine glycosylase n=1 Tax=Lentibacillus sediminis TaxID=1940529 RepID=UPI000C1BA9C9|nr:DNA-deoxyinosine glycosylase [Lentibacillus sediminis]
MSDKIYSFPPVLPERPRVLILGSMPGGVSLEKQQYYGNPRNHFWKILFNLFHSEKIEGYEGRLEFLKQKGIALWDSIGSCYREGSLDANIQAEEPNDIAGLLSQHPTIRLIACNGTKSYQTFRKNFPEIIRGETEVLKMPSTSPIPGKYTKTFDGKVEEWKRILAYLD